MLTAYDIRKFERMSKEVARKMRNFMDRNDYLRLVETILATVGTYEWQQDLGKRLNELEHENLELNGCLDDCESRCELLQQECDSLKERLGKYESL